jgi:hypothetical protein
MEYLTWTNVLLGLAGIAVAAGIWYKAHGSR